MASQDKWIDSPKRQPYLLVEDCNVRRRDTYFWFEWLKWHNDFAILGGFMTMAK